MKENQAKGLSLILLFLSPLIGLFTAIKHLSWQNKKIIIILFITLYGSLLQFGKEADAASYMEMLHRYDGMTFEMFWQTLGNIITLDPLPEYSNDVYVHFLAYFTGSVTGLHVLFFPIVAFVYGYFYVRAMSKILVWDKNFKLTASILFIVVLFIIHRSVTNFQTVRTWTGMWILFNGVLSYHETRKVKYIFLMLCAPLVHFAYFVISIPAFIALFFRRIPAKVLIGIYLLSFFANVSSNKITALAEENTFAKSKVRSYYREGANGEGIDPIMLRREESNSVWYAKYGQTDAVYYGGHAFAIFIIIGGFFRKRMTTLEAALFATGILTASLANFGAFAYAFYSRTMANAVIYILAAVTLMAIRGAFNFNNMPHYRLLNTVKWVCMLIFVPKIFYFVADFLNRTSIFMMGFPFVGWFTDSSNVSIRELLGEFM